MCYENPPAFTVYEERPSPQTDSNSSPFFTQNPRTVTTEELPSL